MLKQVDRQPCMKWKISYCRLIIAFGITMPNIPGLSIALLARSALHWLARTHFYPKKANCISWMKNFLLKMQFKFKAGSYLLFLFGEKSGVPSFPSYLHDLNGRWLKRWHNNCSNMHHALLWNTRDMERYLILSYLGHTSFPFCLFEQYGKKEIKNTSTTSTLDMIIPFLKKNTTSKFVQIKRSSLEFLTENYFHW